MSWIVTSHQQSSNLTATSPAYVLVTIASSQSVPFSLSHTFAFTLPSRPLISVGTKHFLPPCKSLLCLHWFQVTVLSPLFIPYHHMYELTVCPTIRCSEDPKIENRPEEKLHLKTKRKLLHYYRST